MAKVKGRMGWTLRFNGTGLRGQLTGDNVVCGGVDVRC
jgi:hypothetical protein